jgi:hypothetical protein
MKVRGRKSNESWTEVRRTSDESSIYVERVELNRRCGDGGRWRYIAAPRNAATMVGNVVAHNIVAALAGNALQLATFLRHYCSILATLLQQRAGPRSVAAMACNAALLRQHVGPCNVVAMAGNALDLAAVVRWPTTRWTSQWCYDGRQRAGPRSVFFFFFLTFDNLKREKEWEKERSFDTCSLMSRLRLSQLG